jgi:hypothetical protein
MKKIKKIYIATSIIILMITTSSFETPVQTGYGPWQTTSCYKGIDYCVKRNEYNEYSKKYHWSVKFRNRYQTKVSISFTAKESYVRSASTTDRVTIRSGAEHSNWFLIADGNAITVFVDKLRFGEEDSGKYEYCDD